jgi:hypothetical protein
MVMLTRTRKKRLAADDETASGTVGDKPTHNSFSGRYCKKSVKKIDVKPKQYITRSSLSLLLYYYTLSVKSKLEEMQLWPL